MLDRRHVGENARSDERADLGAGGLVGHHRSICERAMLAQAWRRHAFGLTRWFWAGAREGTAGRDYIGNYHNLTSSIAGRRHTHGARASRWSARDHLVKPLSPR